MQVNYSGIIVGIVSFFLIGVFHVIVVKAEYYFSYKVWKVFLLLGLACLAVSLFVESVVLSSILAVLGFIFLWGIKELFEQRNRAAKKKTEKRQIS